jgi:hypothetical protein
MNCPVIPLLHVYDKGAVPPVPVALTLPLESPKHVMSDLKSVRLSEGGLISVAWFDAVHPFAPVTVTV